MLSCLCVDTQRLKVDLTEIRCSFGLNLNKTDVKNRGSVVVKLGGREQIDAHSWLVAVLACGFTQDLRRCFKWTPVIQLRQKVAFDAVFYFLAYIASK